MWSFFFVCCNWHFKIYKKHFPFDCMSFTNWAKLKRREEKREKKPFELIEYAHIFKWFCLKRLIEKTIHAERFSVRFNSATYHFIHIFVYFPRMGTHVNCISKKKKKKYQWQIAIFQSFSGNFILVICKADQSVAYTSGIFSLSGELRAI